MELTFNDVKMLLKIFLMKQYDIRPSLAEKVVDVMFQKGVEYISKENKNE